MAKKKRVRRTSKRPVGKKKSAAPQELVQINFDYILSDLHRVIHVDGVTGAVGPGQDKITLSVFNERMPIPRRESYELNSDGTLAGRTAIDKREAIVRQVEVSLVLNPAAAVAMRTWLDTVLKSIGEPGSQKKTTKKKR